LRRSAPALRASLHLPGFGPGARLKIGRLGVLQEGAGDLFEPGSSDMAKTFSVSRPASGASRLPLLRTLCAALLFVAAPAAFAKGDEPSVADLAASVTDAVVNISAASAGTPSVPLEAIPDLPKGEPFDDLLEQYFHRRLQQPGDKNAPPPPAQHATSLGSGFVIDPSGIVITNNHVIDGANDITVIFADGRKVKAELVGKDEKVDVAVLQIKSDKPLKFVKFGNSEAIRVGDPVVAVGNPFGLGGTVTAGIVSARNRVIDDGPYDNYIQTDAAINKGNSGGPLFDMAGEVIGINTAILSPSGGSIGLGFATPASEVVPIIDQLRRFHEVRRGWLGVRVQEVDDEIADSLSMGAARGALVAAIDPDGPAKPAGLEVGDVILSFDGKPVKSSHDLPALVAATPIGKKVAVTVLRSGKQQTMQATIGRLKDTEVASAETGDGKGGKPAEAEALGLRLAPLDRAARGKYGFGTDTQGVVVTQVDPGSAAEEMDIRPGDVIEQANRNPLTKPSDLADRTQELRKDGRKTVMLLIARPKGDERTLALPLD
jgi:serine protease Do